MDNDSQNQARPFKKRRLTTDERQRAIRACASCRRLKEKCEGGFPCKRCLHFRRPCEFIDAPRRHLPTDMPNHDVSMAGSDSEQARVMYLERLVRHHYPDLRLDLGNLRAAAEQLPSTPSDPVPMNDSDANLEDDVAIDGEHSLDAVDDTTLHYSGEFSYWNFSMRIKQQVSDLMAQTQDQQEQQEPQNVPQYWRVEALHSDSSEIAEARASFPPRQVATFLVHVFFKHACSNYFYVDQQSLTQKLNTMYDKTLQISPKDVCSMAIMLAVFAIGTQYAHLESASRDKASTHTGDGWEGDIGTIFYRSAAKLLPQIIHVASLESVQASLLFGLYALPIDASGLAYIYLNLAIKLAMQNGMHRHLPNHKLDSKSIEMRNKIWWTLYCTERKIGIFHGRPTSVLRQDIDADHPPSSGQTKGLSTLVQLTDYLEEFYTELVLLRKCQKSEVSSILSRISTKTEQLTKWWENSQSAQEIAAHNGINSEMRASMHTRLEYNLIRMFVGRVFLFSRSGMGATPSATSDMGNVQNQTGTNSSKGDGDSVPRPSRTKSFIDTCVQAALDVIKVCGTLRDSGIGLARSSYIEYSACRAALLVLIAYCIQNQTDQFYHKLQKGLDIIREMSSVGDSARSEVLLIESLKRAVKRLHVLSTHKRALNETNPTNTGYDSFKKWTSMLRTGVPVGEDDLSSQDLNIYGDTVGTSSDQSHPILQSPEQNLTWWPSQSALQTNQNLDPAQPHLDGDYTALGHLQSAAGSAFFGYDAIEPSSTFIINSERQLMDSFLAVPDYALPLSENLPGG